VTASVLQETTSAINNGGSAAQASNAFGSNCTVGSTICAVVGWDGGVLSTAPTVTDSAGQTYTKAWQTYDSTNQQAWAGYYFPNNASATKLVATATWASNPTFTNIQTAELGGVSSSPFQVATQNVQVNPGGGSNAITTGNVTPTAQPYIAWAVNLDTGYSGPFGMSVGTGWTLGVKVFDGDGTTGIGLTENRRGTSLSAIAGTWTDPSLGGSNPYVSGIMVFTEASSSDSGSGTSVEGNDVSSGAGKETISGTGASAEAHDTSSASGAEKITGSGTTAEAADTSSGSGAEKISGSGATLEASDTSAASGTEKITGSGATTEGADTSAASGAETITGSGATLEGADVSSGSGTAGSSDSGSGASVEGADVSSGSGAETIAGTAAATEAQDVSAGAGSETIAGSGATLEQHDTSAAAGSETISGSGATVEGADISAGGSSNVGSGASVEGADTSSGAGGESIAGSGAAAESHDTSAASGSETISGSGAGVDGADQSAASATETITGSGGAAESADRSTGEGDTGQGFILLGNAFRSPERITYSVSRSAAFSVTRH